MQSKYQRLQEVKHEIVDKALIYGSIAGILVFAMEIYSLGGSRLWFYQLSDILIVLTLIWVTTQKNKFTIFFKASVVLGAIFILVTTDLIEFGIFSANKTLLVLFPFFAVLAFNSKKMFWAFGFTNLVIVGIACLHLTGVLEVSASDQFGLSAWAINLVLICAICYVSLIVMKSFIETYESMLADLEHQNNEIVDKERSLRDHKDHLEDLVESRTQELKLANGELAKKAEGLNRALTSLSSAQERLINSEKMASLGLLASGVAHEINNPLNHIQGGIAQLQMLLGEKAEEARDIKSQELIDEINGGIKRAAGIVTSLNQYAPNNNRSLSQRCDLHDIINNTVSICQRAHNFDFTVDTNLEAKDYFLLGNSGQIHQVMINLLTNAIQSLGKEGAIKVRTVSSKETIVISVSDNGCGIEKENLSRIYEPFFTTKQAGEGTGLGMYIVFGIIKEHQGNIQVKSELGQGTEFTVTFPLMSV